MGIKFKDVNYSYNKKKDPSFEEQAIKNINLNIKKNDEFLMILGSTGSGKSTLMQHINALILPTSGSVEIGDKVITPKKRKNPKLKDIRKKVGYVFQFPEYQLFEETVLKDIMFAPLNFGYTKEEAKELAIKYAMLLNIENLLDKSPFELSGGQMRKVAIAGVIASNPEVLLLDEPTRGLDPRAAVEIMNFFNKLHHEEKKSIIMITHDLDIAYQYATRIVVLKDGEIVYDGSKSELFKLDFLKYNLKKPLVLTLIDELNKKFNYNLSYNLDTLEKVLNEVRMCM